MRFTTLDEWLRWQETLHPRAIDLGLERVVRVLERLSLRTPPHRILAVGGTNGKGSCVALLEAMLRAGGYRVGAYTSPHILRYNERIRLDGIETSDVELCASFARVDEARGDTSLTYFEFGTLAALDLFAHRGVDVAVLEVGMGGRLDAVNAVEADAAIVASVGLDHQEWLGPDRESIGREKAGIYRASRPAVCGDRRPPGSLLRHAQGIGSALRVLGKDFDWKTDGVSWRWDGPEGLLDGLPTPALPGRIQLDNAASVLAALMALRGSLPVTEQAIRTGLAQVRLRGRFERRPGAVEVILDVAHNPDAARVLAENLRMHPVAGRTFAVVGMLADKSVEGVVSELRDRFDRWYAGGLGGPRGQAADALARRIRSACPDAGIRECQDVRDAYAAARADARAGDRIVVFGSFLTVAAVPLDSR